VTTGLRENAAREAAEAAVRTWQQAGQGLLGTISPDALAEIMITMSVFGPGADGTTMETAWRRKGSTLFEGALYLAGELVWTCAHRHSSRSEAQACAIAEAHERQAGDGNG
jgi:hypothetical protein